MCATRTASGLTLQEKALYHQVHPLKLATDISAQVVSTYFSWVHNLALALVTMLVPPVVMSALLLNTLDFSPIRDSALGRYLKRSMTSAMQAVRLAGTLPIVFGAWYHQPWLIGVGLAVILFGWLRGLLFRAKA